MPTRVGQFIGNKKSPYDCTSLIFGGRLDLADWGKDLPKGDLQFLYGDQPKVMKFHSVWGILRQKLRGVSHTFEHDWVIDSEWFKTDQNRVYLLWNLGRVKIRGCVMIPRRKIPKITSKIRN